MINLTKEPTKRQTPQSKVDDDELMTMMMATMLEQPEWIQHSSEETAKADRMSDFFHRRARRDFFSRWPQHARRHVPAVRRASRQNTKY